jgi:hypothetical protein
MKKYLWKDSFDTVCSENDGYFGGNHFDEKKDAFNCLKKLDKLGAKIKILDYENIRITLPKNCNKKEKILMYILIECYCSSIDKRKTGELDLEWS